MEVAFLKNKLEDLGKKISKKALLTGEPPESVSHYVRRLIKKNLGKPTED